MKEYIFFDIGGTLIKTDEGIVNALKYAFGEHNLDLIIPPGETSFIGPPIMDSLVDVWGLDGKTARAVARAYRKYLDEKGFCESRLQDGAAAVLESLSRNGKKLYAVSSEWQALVEKLLKHHRISRYFTGIYGAVQTGTRTSKEDIISQILSESRFSAAEKKTMVIIGDRWRDMLAGEILGIDFVGVSYGYADRSEFSSVLPERMADSPEELEQVLRSL